MNRTRIQELIERRQSQREGSYRVEMTAPDRFLLNGHQYVILDNYREAFTPEAFADRFSPFLSKYDYLVGDWGYGQLRLRGFYAADNPLFDRERSLKTAWDYLYEECNFGCAYFVVRNLEVRTPRRAGSNHRGVGRPGASRFANRAGQSRSQRRRRDRSTTSGDRREPNA